MNGNNTTNDQKRNEWLVLRCQLGDRNALSELIETWERPVLFYVRRFMSEHDAYDTMQKVWVKVIRDISKIREPRAFASWLFRIARNTAITQGTSSLRIDRQMAEDVDFAQMATPEIETQNAELVHRALPQLKSTNREVLTLFFLDEFSIREIASIVGIPPGTVKSRLHHAKIEIRDVISRLTAGGDL